MQTLTLYFNERSAPAHGISESELHRWRPWAIELIEALRQIAQWRPEFTVNFPHGLWHTILVDKTLSHWIRTWIDRDRYRQLVARISEASISDDLLCEVHYDGTYASGLTLAKLAKTWAISFPEANSPWLDHVVAAHEIRLDDNSNVLEVACDIPHISCRGHSIHWQFALVDWGRHVSNTCRIAVVEGYAIEMYPAPREHGYPHVHLVDGSDRHTLAKFRVDVFERMEGRPNWDATMRGWIAENRELLLSSWERCQRGDHPYQVK